MVEAGKGTLITVATSDTAIFTPSSGRSFDVRSLEITNTGSSDALIDLYDGTTAAANLKAKYQVATKSTLALNTITGLRFYTSVRAVADAATSANPVFVRVGGEEI